MNWQKMVSSSTKQRNNKKYKGRIALHQLDNDPPPKKIPRQIWSRWRKQYGMQSLREAVSGAGDRAAAGRAVFEVAGDCV